MKDTLGTVVKWQDTVLPFFIQYGIQICGALIILGVGMFSTIPSRVPRGLSFKSQI